MTAPNKPAVDKSATSATAPASKAAQSPRFTVNPVWSTVGTLLHVAFSLFCIYLTPFGRTGTLSATTFTTQLYDLLYTEKLADFDRSYTDLQGSYVGPALLATFTRPFGLVFDEKIRNLLFDKVVPHVKFLPASLVSTAKLYILETRMWHLFVARALLAVMVALSAAALRHALSLKFKSAALPRIYTALCLASAIPLLAATNLSSQAFSIVLLNLALAALFNGKFRQLFSLLTVNAVIFDSIGGSILLLASFISLSSVESFKQSTALASILVTFPVAGVVTFTLDSLFYNKFIWPQGEILFRHMYTALSAIKAVDYVEVARLALSLKPAELVNSKQFANALIILAPVSLVYIFGRSNRYVRAMLGLYTLSVIGNLMNAYASASNALVTCTPLMAPLLVAASISVLGGLKSTGSTVKKSLTYLFFFGVLVPSLSWGLGRIHLEISGAQQATGEALMALNRKILKDSQEGVPVRVFIDFDSSSTGYSRFIELTRNRAIYATEHKGRYDYFVGSPVNCPQDKAMKLFNGFSKIDIKALKVIQTEQVGVYRHSSTCPASTRPNLPKFDTSISNPALLPAFISARFFNGQFSKLKEQRDFIAKHLGRFNHKKVSNSMALVAYLYQNILDQI